jgi:hypothetical protein
VISQFTSVTINDVHKDLKPDDPLVQVEHGLKTDNNWPKLPTNNPHYKNKWTSSDFFEKPYDCNEQESQYKVKKSYTMPKKTSMTFSAPKNWPRSHA